MMSAYRLFAFCFTILAFVTQEMVARLRITHVQVQLVFISFN